LLVPIHDTAPCAVYTLSLHDALPISGPGSDGVVGDVEPEGGEEGVLLAAGGEHALGDVGRAAGLSAAINLGPPADGQEERQRGRSEEHTSELQSRRDLVCRLLLEKKK